MQTRPQPQAKYSKSNDCQLAWQDDCIFAKWCIMNNTPGTAAHLFERALAFLTGSQRPPVLQAFEQLGIEPDLIADVLGVHRRMVLAWRCGRIEIPPEHHVRLLAHLAVLLSWLFAAETDLGRHGPPGPLWSANIEAARNLLEMEMRAPMLARTARAVADELDQTTRHKAIHVAAQWRLRSHSRRRRRARHDAGSQRWKEKPRRRTEPSASTSMDSPVDSRKDLLRSKAPTDPLSHT
jgi:hypothetical protein